MKKILFLVLASCFIAACADENPVGDPIKIVNERYSLPEEGASQWANDYIVDLYEESGSYITYHPTQADFVWTYTPAPDKTSGDSIAVGDPQYVEPLLRFIDKIWISNITSEGKKSRMLPYRILLVDSIWTYNQSGNVVNIPAKVTGMSIAFGGVNAKFAEMSAEEKQVTFAAFNNAIWNAYYAANNLTPFPDKEFNAITDWDAMLEAYNAAPYDSPEQKATPFKFGVMPDMVRTAVGPGRFEDRLGNWWNPNYGPDLWAPKLDQWLTKDKAAALSCLLSRTDTEMAAIFNHAQGPFPKIQQKWDMLIDWYLNEIGIDARAMANMTFE